MTHGRKGGLAPPRAEELRAAEIMNGMLSSLGDPRRVTATGGDGGGHDLTITEHKTTVGSGEVSFDHATDALRASAELGRAEYTIQLTEGRGTWLIGCRPDVEASRLRRVMPHAIADVVEGCPERLGFDETDFAWANACLARSGDHGASEAHARAWSAVSQLADIGVLSMLRSHSNPPDTAHIGIAGAGVSSGCGDALADFVTECLIRHPHAQNVDKLRDRAGEQHVVVLMGTATRDRHWAVFHPVAHKGGFDTAPKAAPALPTGITDAWVIHLPSEWAAWWSRPRGWVLR